jgi:hypothetical protein
MDPQSQDAPLSEPVAAFFQKHRTGLVALVFTDLVDSTALRSQLVPNTRWVLEEKLGRTVDCYTCPT